MTGKKQKGRSSSRAHAPKASAGGPRPVVRYAGYGLVGVLVVALIAVMANSPAKVPDGIPEGAQEVAIGDPDHIAGPIDYPVPVPAGGPHNVTPLDCGVYDFEVPRENVVHSLEHGAVWVTYQPGIGADAVGALEAATRTRTKTILSPIAAQPAPVMATAWGWQLELADADDIRLRQFIAAFEGAGTSPEPGAPCVGGLRPTGA